MLIEMAAQGGDEGANVYKGHHKIELAHFFECLQGINTWALKPWSSLVVCHNALPENIMVYWGVKHLSQLSPGFSTFFLSLSIKGFPGVNF